MLVTNASKQKNIVRFNKVTNTETLYDECYEDLHPTTETLEAMEEVKLGKLKSYSSFKELVKSIG